nr:DUF1801 domain-containing protein [uncultured Actinoplanes sp.]
MEKFTAEERSALKDRAKELKGRGKADPESEVLAKIEEMSDADRVLASRVHALIRANAPALTPRLWYGMPAYASQGKILCHFQPATKFKTRYATLGFSDVANLDEDTMWPTAYALTSLTPETEARIVALLKQAVS